MILSPGVFWVFFWRVARGEKGGRGTHDELYVCACEGSMLILWLFSRGCLVVFYIAKLYMLSSFIFLKKEKS